MVKVGEQGIFLSDDTAKKVSPYILSQLKKTLVLNLNSVQSSTETDPLFSAWLATPPNVSTFTNDAGYLTSFSETDPIYTASSWYSTTNNSSNWNTAFSWGNHASAGYLTSITSGQVTAALGYTPYDATNPSGYITSSSLSSYVPTARTLTINGTTYDLSADRTWSVGTVTDVAALTLGTTGTDLSSSVATGTTTPVITLNVPTASATNRGALSSTDWSTFNNKFTLPSLTAGSVLFSNGTTIAQDNANFFWNDTNNRLGIGTNAPSAKLEVRGISDFWGLQVGNGTVGALFQVYGGKAGFVGFNGSAYNSLDIRSGISTQLFLATNGNTGIGTTSPTAVLHIKAGTATANTAPLQFTTGTLETVARAGVMEYNNTFHLTNSDATRRHIVTAPNTTKVTAAAPYTNDGYIIVNIGGTDFKILTTA